MLKCFYHLRTTLIFPWVDALTVIHLSQASRLPIVIFVVNCVLGIFFMFSPENKGNKLVCFHPRICLDADTLPIDAYHPWQSTAAAINWWLSIRELASVILLPHRYRLQPLTNRLQRLSRRKIKALPSSEKRPWTHFPSICQNTLWGGEVGTVCFHKDWRLNVLPGGGKDLCCHVCLLCKCPL